MLFKLLHCSVHQILVCRILHRSSEVSEYRPCCVKVADDISLILVCLFIFFTATRLKTLDKIVRVPATVTVLFGNWVSMVYFQHLTLNVRVEVGVELFYGQSSRHIHFMVPGFFQNKNRFILDV